MDYKKLVRTAMAAKRHSYSPYSKFRVGAALVSSRGLIFTGCNVENSSFSLTLCAERIAIFKAYSEGVRKFRAMAIVSDSTRIIPPCGACRQVLLELAPGIDIILADAKGNFTLHSIADLLPHPFSGTFLKS